MSTVTLEMLERMLVQTIVAAAENVHRTYSKCASARAEVDRLERELVKAREKQQDAIDERDAATNVVHGFVREYGDLASRHPSTTPTTEEPS